MFGQREDGETFGDVFLEPRGQLGRSVAIAGDELGQRGFGLGEVVRRPDRFQLLADAPGDLGVGGVMDGVLSKMELAALPCGTTENSASGGAQAAVIVRCNELHASQAPRDQAFED